MKFDRRISRRSFLAAAGVSAAALALTACGGSSSTAASGSRYIIADIIHNIKHLCMYSVRKLNIK